MAQLLTLQGRYEDALRELHRAQQIEDTAWARSSQAIALARRAEGRNISVVNALRRLESKQYVPPYELAVAYAGLGDKERTFEYLERMYEERSFNLA